MDKTQPKAMRIDAWTAKAVVQRKHAYVFCCRNDSDKRYAVVSINVRGQRQVIGRGASAVSAWQDAARAVDAAKAMRTADDQPSASTPAVVESGLRSAQPGPPPRCPTHGDVMCEHFDIQGRYMVPTGKYWCYACGK